MSRANEVANAVVKKVFSGRRANNVEVHLSMDDVRDIAMAAYDAGRKDGLASSHAEAEEEAEKARLNREMSGEAK